MISIGQEYMSLRLKYRCIYTVFTASSEEDEMADLWLGFVNSSLYQWYCHLTSNAIIQSYVCIIPPIETTWIQYTMPSK